MFYTNPLGTVWYYREMGSRNKKTGKLSYYNVRVTDYKIDDFNVKQGSSIDTPLVSI